MLRGLTDFTSGLLGIPGVFPVLKQIYMMKEDYLALDPVE